MTFKLPLPYFRRKGGRYQSWRSMSSWCGQVMTENWGRLERIDDLRLTNSQEYSSARGGGVGIKLAETSSAYAAMLLSASWHLLWVCGAQMSRIAVHGIWCWRSLVANTPLHVTEHHHTEEDHSRAITSHEIVENCSQSTGCLPRTVLSVSNLRPMHLEGEDTSC